MVSQHVQQLINEQCIGDIDLLIQQQEQKWNNDLYYFDPVEAKRFYNFASKMNLDKGVKGKKLILLKYQFEICSELLCVKRNIDNLRRFREAHINVGRKNAKSFMVALILTYLYFFKPVYGCEYIITANTTKQAALLYNTIKNFINNSPLKQLCKIVDSQKQIYQKGQNTYLRVLAAEGGSLDSYCAACFVLDEIHELKDTSVYDKLKTGQGILDEPLGITITTASSGKNDMNLEYELYCYSKKIESGEYKDDSFYFKIYEANENCNINDQEQWFKANPALGHFRKIEDIVNLALRATLIKTREASFRRYFLNQHVSLIHEQAINMMLWGKCIKKFNISDLEGLYCASGLDIGGTNDLTAYVKCFYDDDEDKYIIYPYIFTPKDTLEERQEVQNVPYVKWVNESHIIALPGSYINTDKLIDFINKDIGKYKEVAFDRWGAYDIANKLSENFDVIKFGQGFKTMSPAIRNFENMLVSGQLIIADNPVLTWMAENVTAVTDDADSIKYSKKKSKNKIDGIIAMIMAFSICYNFINDPESPRNISKHFNDEYSM